MQTSDLLQISPQSEIYIVLTQRQLFYSQILHLKVCLDFFIWLFLCYIVSREPNEANIRVIGMHSKRIVNADYANENIFFAHKYLGNLLKVK